MGGRRRNQMHAYQQEDMDRVKHIQLPPKIKCGRCCKSFAEAKFSNKQLTDARYQIRDQLKITKPIVCQNCTGQQVVEIECTMCGKTKGLEEFAKSQRNKPDTAQCFRCTEIQVNDEAINKDRYEDPDKAFCPGDHSAGKTPDYFSGNSSTTESSSDFGDEWQSVNGERDGNDQNSRNKHKDGGIALSNQFQAMNINGADTETSTVFEFTHPNNGNSDGWNAAHTRSWKTKSISPASTTSGFDANKYGHPSARSTSGTMHTFGSSVVERSETSSDVRSNGWHKKSSIPLGDTTVAGYGPMQPMGDAISEVASDLNAWASDGDEDDDEDDSDSDDSDGDDTVI